MTTTMVPAQAGTRYADVDARCTRYGNPLQGVTLHGMAATALHRHTDGAIAMQYHDTEIIVWNPDNTVRIAAGGWYTQTTKRRIEETLSDYRNLGDGIVVTLTGNPWRIIVKRRNPAYDGVSGEPYYLVLANHAFTEGAVIDLDTGAIRDGHMLAGYEAANKATNKAIKAYLDGLTEDAVYHASEIMEGSLYEEVLAGRYSLEMFRLMYLHRSGADTSTPEAQHRARICMQMFIYPIVRQTYVCGGYDLTYVKRELASFLRGYLLVGPVPIRRNYGMPRAIR